MFRGASLFRSLVASAAVLFGAISIARADSTETNSVAIPTPPPSITNAMATLTAPQVPVPPAVHRDHPVMIVLKLDDLRDQHPNWQKVVEEIKLRNIKASIGIICDSLEKMKAHPSYYQWIKDTQASGFIEFWFHGYDHAAHTEDGQVYGEFNHRTYEDQKQRFVHSQELAQQTLGFAFHAFGPPGSGVTPQFVGYNEDTCRVMQEDPEMKVWMYPSLVDDMGQKLEAQGKVTILDRVGPVNIEQPTFVPNFAAFVKGYNANPTRDYFVLQGHPWAWTPARWQDFDKILDFLQQQNAIFLTPSELAAKLKTKTGA